MGLWGRRIRSSKHGIDGLPSSQVTLGYELERALCVTSRELIDKPLPVASHGAVIISPFGDMLHVPRSSRDCSV